MKQEHIDKLKKILKEVAAFAEERMATLDKEVFRFQGAGVHATGLEVHSYSPPGEKLDLGVIVEYGGKGWGSQMTLLLSEDGQHVLLDQEGEELEGMRC